MLKYLFSYFHIFLQREEQALINANNMKPVVKVRFFSFFAITNIVMYDQQQVQLQRGQRRQ